MSGEYTKNTQALCGYAATNVYSVANLAALARMRKILFFYHLERVKLGYLSERTITCEINCFFLENAQIA